ncbi:MAG: cell division protein FtsQ [Bacteroidota bacterium]|nr:cell division protein FtsQ [Bacteroidota bacterium]MDP4204704.1 cell division protein FtsQ [Bacteroidota bacterium]
MIKRKVFVLIMAILGLGFLTFTVGFVSSEKHKTRCTSLEIDIVDSLNGTFIRKSDILALINRKIPGVVGVPLNRINLNKIEEAVKSHPTVRDAVVFTTLYDRQKVYGGKVVIKVWQQIPLLRVISPAEDYYVSRDGKRMPVSSSYVPYVIVASGAITHKMAQTDLFKLADFINKDKLWKAQIEQIYVNSSGEIYLAPRVGDHIIELGGTDSLDVKFRNLKALYNQTFNAKGWNLYDTISVKYTNQVVCSKK